MARTRATTVPIPTPARQGASKLATGAIGRREAVARGRGIGRWRTSSRGRGQTPGPASNRAMTPPTTDEVVRKGEEGENEQVQDEELLPQPTPKMINQVLTYLSRLSDQGQTPLVFSAPAPQVPGVQHAATVAPRMDASLEVGMFPWFTIGPI